MANNRIFLELDASLNFLLFFAYKTTKSKRKVRFIQISKIHLFGHFQVLIENLRFCLSLWLVFLQLSSPLVLTCLFQHRDLNCP